MKKHFLLSLLPAAMLSLHAETSNPLPFTLTSEDPQQSLIQLLSNDSTVTSSPSPDAHMTDQGMKNRPKSCYTRYDIRGSVDFLWWIGGVAGLEAVTVRNKEQSSPLISDLLPMKFSWAPAFRIGADYGIPNRWDIGAMWTRFHKTSNYTVYATPPIRNNSSYTSALLPVWIDDGAEPEGTIWKESAAFSFHFDEVDIGFSTDFKMTKAVSIQPGFGYRCLVLNQDFRLFEFGGNATYPINVGVYRMDTSFSGNGLYLALDSSWLAGMGFSFFGGASFGMTWGKYNESRTSKVTPSTIGETPGNVGFEVQAVHNKEIVLPEIALKAGLNWHKDFNWYIKGLDLRAGYEFHEIIGGFMIWQRGTDSFAGTSFWNNDVYNVYLQGLTLGTDLSF